MRRRRHQVYAHLAPTPDQEGPTGQPAPWAGLLNRRVPLPRGLIRFVVRRLLVAGALVVCGWLISNGQSAHAADTSSSHSSLRNPVAAAAATAARGLSAPRTTGNTGKIGDAREIVASAGAAVSPARSGDASPERSPSARSSARSPLAQSPSARSPSARSASARSSPARSSAGLARPTLGGTSPGPTAGGILPGLLPGAGQAVRQAAGTIGVASAISENSPGTTGAAGSAGTGDGDARSAAPVAPSGAGASGLAELLDPAVRPPPSLGVGSLPSLARFPAFVPALGPLAVRGGLPIPVPDAADLVTGPVTDAVRQPIGAIGAVLAAGPADPLIRSLGVLTARLDGTLWQLEGITAQLVSRVLTLAIPVVRPLGPLGEIAVTAVAHVAVSISSLNLPDRLSAACRSATGSRAGPWPVTTASPPAGSGHVGGGTADSIPAATLPVAPGDQPPGSAARYSTDSVLCGQWPPPPRGPVVPYAHMSGQGHGPLSPGDTNVPLPGGSNQAPHSPSQTDGTGDAPPSWEARVTETFVPIWVVAPPAVRTAADEPVFSPD